MRNLSTYAAAAAVSLQPDGIFTSTEQEMALEAAADNTVQLHHQLGFGTFKNETPQRVAASQGAVT